jgi:hypothetical protein
MKTFDEALDGVMLEIHVKDIPAALEQAEAETNELQSRCGDLASEISNNPRTDRYLDGLMDLCCPDSEKLAKTAFIMGILIGMDMERSECAGIAQDGSPDPA